MRRSFRTSTAVVAISEYHLQLTMKLRIYMGRSHRVWNSSVGRLCRAWVAASGSTSNAICESLLAPSAELAKLLMATEMR